MITPTDDFDDGPDLDPEDPLTVLLRPARAHLGPPPGRYAEVRRGAARRRLLRAAAGAGATCATLALAVLLPLRLTAPDMPVRPTVPLAPPSLSGSPTAPTPSTAPTPAAVPSPADSAERFRNGSVPGALTRISGDQWALPTGTTAVIIVPETHTRVVVVPQTPAPRDDSSAARTPSVAPSASSTRR